MNITRVSIIQQKFLRARRLAFEPHSKVQVRAAQKTDVASILNVEWCTFNSFSDLDGRWTPGKLKYWLTRKSEMFLVGEVKEKDGFYIIAYAVLVPLAETGYIKYLNGEGRSIVHLDKNDIDLSDDPQYLSLEVIACINPADVYTGMLLIRNAISMIPASCEVFTASPASEFGMKLVKRYNFKKLWIDPLSDWTLYAIDLADPKSKELFRKLRLQR